MNYNLTAEMTNQNGAGARQPRHNMNTKAAAKHTIEARDHEQTKKNTAVAVSDCP
jgi:hypothetical protein